MALEDHRLDDEFCCQLNAKFPKINTSKDVMEGFFTKCLNTLVCDNEQKLIMDGCLTICGASWFLAVKKCAQLKETKRQIHVKCLCSDVLEIIKRTCSF